MPRELLCLLHASLVFNLVSRMRIHVLLPHNSFPWFYLDCVSAISSSNFYCLVYCLLLTNTFRKLQWRKSCFPPPLFRVYKLACLAAFYSWPLLWLLWFFLDFIWRLVTIFSSITTFTFTLRLFGFNGAANYCGVIIFFLHYNYFFFMMLSISLELPSLQGCCPLLWV